MTTCRPGFVLGVDERTPALLACAGQALRLERFGVGTQVIYPPDAVPSSDPVSLIDAALETPVGAEPLPVKLAAVNKLAIVVADHTRLLPRMRFDVRRSIVERVLEHAARAGVDDVEIVIASGLNRRWGLADITANLGDRVATSFLPDGLITSHDVTADDLVTIGEVEGQPVKLNPKVAQADLVVLVNLVAELQPGCPVALGLTDAATINSLAGMHQSPQKLAQVGELVAKLPSYAITAVLGQPLLGSQLSFMNKREWEWRLPDQLAFAGARQLAAAFPKLARQRFNANPRADYAISDLIGGDPGQVANQASQAWRAANIVELPHQADVLVSSVWGACFDPGNPVGSPISAAHHAIVERLGSHTGKPALRPGGVMIAFHPLLANFSHRTQSAAADFFATVLPETLDVAEIASRFEPIATTDPWYLNLYRDHFAYHPLRVFHDWYRIRQASAQIGELIWVGADRKTAAMLGNRATSSYTDALELAADRIGGEPKISYLRGPGRALGHLP